MKEMCTDHCSVLKPPHFSQISLVPVAKEDYGAGIGSSAGKWWPEATVILLTVAAPIERRCSIKF